MKRLSREGNLRWRTENFREIPFKGVKASPPPPQEALIWFPVVAFSALQRVPFKNTWPRCGDSLVTRKIRHWPAVIPFSLRGCWRLVVSRLEKKRNEDSRGINILSERGRDSTTVAFSFLRILFCLERLTSAGKNFRQSLDSSELQLTSLATRPDEVVKLTSKPQQRCKYSLKLHPR